jgi:hypothetical protein
MTKTMATVVRRRRGLETMAGGRLGTPSLDLFPLFLFSWDDQ